VTDFSKDNPDVAAASSGPTANVSGEELVLVAEAPTSEEGEVMRVTLEAAGIPCFLQSTTASSFSEGIDANVGRLWSHGVFVAPSNVEAARAILSASPLTEEELAAEEAADPTTLEEAEARVKDAS
jgi:hypothetical protein